MAEDERLSKDDILNLATEGFSYELKELIQLFKSDTGSEIITFFSNYESFLNEKRFSYLGSNLKEKLSKNNVIDATEQSDEARKLFACANMAASCEIFGGWSIPMSTIGVNQSDEYLRMAIANTIKNQPNLGQNMAVRLNNGDTIRVIQILKLLDLMDTKPDCYQICTGSSIGIRDRVATHVTPHISINHFINNAPVQFSTVNSQADDIVLIDIDTNLTEAFAKLNDSSDKIHAYINDVYLGLDEIAELVSDDKIKPRTLVTAYRLEPRAYTDIKGYLDRIGQVIASQADFVTTIGSGDTDSEFEHRKQVLDDLYNDLVDRGMNPVRIKMYKGETIQQQRSSPLFGLNQYASYDILYCQLIKERFKN